MTEDFEIIVGTYEQFLLGYKVIKEEKKYRLERSFATKDHVASIRTTSSMKHYLASGAADDCINIYDMKRRTESGKLMHHNGTVNCVSFTPDATHLVSCSSDGSIAVVRCGNWQLEKHWTSAHKNSEVNTLAIHPTGKCTLSVGTDGVLRLWNLVNGHHAYAINLVPRLKLQAKNITVLQWSPDGEKYLMAANNQLDVYSRSTAGICAEVTFDVKIVCVEFINDNVIVIGHENGTLRIYDIEEQSELLQTVGHDSRVKCLKHKGKFIVSASSSGEVKVWKYVKQKLKMLTKATCDARITCMTLTQL
ncbi:GSCOCG00006414001-RA-CDS [Cotesia congregata]|nr:GSCOCG00006414001-RA-CDS [Cotesia congregata]